ncbi:MAG TPA: ABC transporter permease [Chloroflexota bacterium]
MPDPTEIPSIVTEPDVPIEFELEGRRRGGWRLTWRRYRANRAALVGLLIVLTLITCAILAPWITPYPLDAGSATNFALTLQPPSQAHIFGTDDVGRDIFTRVVFGARLSITIAAIVTLCSALIGVAVGSLSAFYGRWMQWIAMGITDSFLALPALVLAIAVAAILGHSTSNLVIALIVVWWPGYARLAEGLVQSEKGRDYVEAAHAAGVRGTRVLWRHVVPNVLAPIIVRMGQDIGYVILTAAGLGFVGLGVQPPDPEWGVMVSDSHQYTLQAWWYSLYPGVAVAIAVLGFSLVGNGLQQALNIRQAVEVK